MSKKVFDGIMEGALEAVAIAKGEAAPGTYRIHVPDELDVRAIRKRLKLTQSEFSTRYGFNVARVRDWEQRRSAPDGAMRAYLMVIERKPEAVNEVLRIA